MLSECGRHCNLPHWRLLLGYKQVRLELSQPATFDDPAYGQPQLLHRCFSAGGSGSKSISTGIIIGALAAAVVLVLALALCVYCMCCRNRRTAASAKADSPVAAHKALLNEHDASKVLPLQYRFHPILHPNGDRSGRHKRLETDIEASTTAAPPPQPFVPKMHQAMLHRVSLGPVKPRPHPPPMEQVTVPGLGRQSALPVPVGYAAAGIARQSASLAMSRSTNRQTHGSGGFEFDNPMKIMSAIAATSMGGTSPTLAPAATPAAPAAVKPTGNYSASDFLLSSQSDADSAVLESLSNHGARRSPSGTVFLSPADCSMDAQARITAANASLQSFKHQLTEDSAQATVQRLVSKHQAAAHPLLSPAAQSTRSSQTVEHAMHYLTSNACFAGERNLASLSTWPSSTV